MFKLLAVMLLSAVAVQASDLPEQEISEPRNHQDHGCSI